MLTSCAKYGFLACSLLGFCAQSWSHTSFSCRRLSRSQLQTEELISLESLLLAGQKKVPKIYAIAVHPLQPHIVAVGANAGQTSHTRLACHRGLSCPDFSHEWHAILVTSTSLHVDGPMEARHGRQHLHMVPNGPFPTAFIQHAKESCSAQHPGSIFSAASGAHPTSQAWA